MRIGLETFEEVRVVLDSEGVGLFCERMKINSVV